MSLKGRIDRLGGTRTVTRYQDGLTDILTQEDWVEILNAPDQEAELLRRCPNYYRLDAALRAQRPDGQGVRRLRI